MSAEYYVFLEAKIDDNWICVNPGYRNTKGEFELNSLYWNGSRTMFSNAFDELREIGNRPFYDENVKEDVLSEAVVEWLKHECNEDALKDRDWAKSCILTVPFVALKEKVGDPNLFDYSGIVKKHDVALYKAGEIEDFKSISPEELKELPTLAQEMYQIYDWDDFCGWRRVFKELLKRANVCTEAFCAHFWLQEVPETRFVVFMF